MSYYNLPAMNPYANAYAPAWPPPVMAAHPVYAAAAYSPYGPYSPSMPYAGAMQPSYAQPSYAQPYMPCFPPYAPHYSRPPPYHPPPGSRPVPVSAAPPAATAAPMAQPVPAAPMHMPMAPQPQPQAYPQAYAPHMAAPPPAASGPVVHIDEFGLPAVPGDMPVNTPQVFRVEEKLVSVTRDSFVVHDQQGSLRYKVDGQFSLHERKILKDPHGQILLKLREARLRLRDRITIFNSSNVPLLTLQKSAAFQMSSKKVNVFLGGHPSGQPVLVITGDKDKKVFNVMNAQNQEIAEIRRSRMTLKNLVTDQDSYDVTVNVGSPALMCFITVAIDEIYED